MVRMAATFSVATRCWHVSLRSPQRISGGPARMPNSIPRGFPGCSMHIPPPPPPPSPGRARLHLRKAGSELRQTDLVGRDHRSGGMFLVDGPLADAAAEHGCGGGAGRVPSRRCVGPSCRAARTLQWSTDAAGKVSTRVEAPKKTAEQLKPAAGSSVHRRSAAPPWGLCAVALRACRR